MNIIRKILSLHRSLSAGRFKRSLSIHARTNARTHAQIFYTEGTDELRRARLWLLQYSIPRARARVQLSKRKQVCVWGGVDG